jgi:hypothetical protein
MDKAEIEIGFGDFEQLAAPLLAFSATFEPSLRRGCRLNRKLAGWRRIQTMMPLKYWSARNPCKL